MTRTKSGRPRVGRDLQKPSAMSIYVSPTLRQAIEEEADRTGRSLSQVAEMWLARGMEVDAVRQLAKLREALS